MIFKSANTDTKLNAAEIAVVSTEANNDVRELLQKYVVKEVESALDKKTASLQRDIISLKENGATTKDIQRALGKLDQQLEPLEAVQRKTYYVSENIDVLSKDIGELKDSFSEIQPKLNNAFGRINSVYEDLNNCNKEIADIEKKISDSSKAQNQLKDTINNLKKQTEELEKSVSGKRLTNLNSSIDKTNSAIEALQRIIKEYQQRNSELEKLWKLINLTRTEMSSEVQGLENHDIESADKLESEQNMKSESSIAVIQTHDEIKFILENIIGESREKENKKRNLVIISLSISAANILGIVSLILVHFLT